MTAFFKNAKAAWQASRQRSAWGNVCTLNAFADRHNGWKEFAIAFIGAFVMLSLARLFSWKSASYTSNLVGFSLMIAVGVCLTYRGTLIFSYWYDNAKTRLISWQGDLYSVEWLFRWGALVVLCAPGIAVLIITTFTIFVNAPVY